MPRWWPRVTPVFNDAVICKSYIGPPAFGPVLPTGQVRLLLGWDHPLDDPNELRHGQIYCWVTKGLVQPKFQLFRTSGNRSNVPGQRVDCGVVNYSMVRMIHSYWAEGGVVPRDMAWKPDYDDKARLRSLYHRLVRERNGDSDDEEDLDTGSPDAPDVLPLLVEQIDPKGKPARNGGDDNDGPQVDNSAHANLQSKRRAPEVSKVPGMTRKRVRRARILDIDYQNLHSPNDLTVAAQDGGDDVKHPRSYYDDSNPGTSRNPVNLDSSRPETARNSADLDLDDDFEQITALGSGARNIIDLDASSTTRSRAQTEAPFTSLFGNGIPRVEADGKDNGNETETNQKPKDLTIVESQVVKLDDNESIPFTPLAQDDLVTDETQDAQIAGRGFDADSNDTTLVYGQDTLFIEEDTHPDSPMPTNELRVTDKQTVPTDLDE